MYPNPHNNKKKTQGRTNTKLGYTCTHVSTVGSYIVAWAVAQSELDHPNRQLRRSLFILIEKVFYSNKVGPPQMIQLDYYTSHLDGNTCIGKPATLCTPPNTLRLCYQLLSSTFSPLQSA